MITIINEIIKEATSSDYFTFGLLRCPVPNEDAEYSISLCSLFGKDSDEFIIPEKLFDYIYDIPLDRTDDDYDDIPTLIHHLKHYSRCLKIEATLDENPLSETPLPDTIG